MSQLKRVNGNTKPVFAFDILNGSAQAGAATVASLVQPQGPKLDFFAVDLKANIAAEQDTGRAVEVLINTVTQLATTHMYQSEVAGQVSLAVYPTGAWTAASLQTAVRALGTVTVKDAVVDNPNTTADETAAAVTFDFSGVTVTNVGFKLATS